MGRHCTMLAYTTLYIPTHRKCYQLVSEWLILLQLPSANQYLVSFHCGLMVSLHDVGRHEESSLSGTSDADTPDNVQKCFSFEVSATYHGATFESQARSPSSGKMCSCTTLKHCHGDKLQLL